MKMPGCVLKVKILINYRIHCLNAHEVTGQDYPCYFMAKFKEESKFHRYNNSGYTVFTFLVAR